MSDSDQGLDAVAAGFQSMEDELYALDSEMHTLRQRIFLLEQGLSRPAVEGMPSAEVDDPVQELARLRLRFRELGDRFVVVYRRWNQGEE